MGLSLTQKVVDDPKVTKALEEVQAQGMASGDAAGGDLTGTYPDPQLAPDSVGSAEIAAGAVGTSEAPGFVNSTVETLKVIRGRINTASSGTILQGSGFTITRNGTGDLTVTFTAAFSALPSVPAPGAEGGDLIGNLQGAPTTTTARFQLFSTGGTLTDGIFSFIAIGPR